MRAAPADARAAPDGGDGPETLRKFQEEVEEYVELRKKVLKKIPPVSTSPPPRRLPPTRKPSPRRSSPIGRGETGRHLQEPVEAAIRRILQREFSGPDGPALIKAIKQGNPRVEGNPRPGPDPGDQAGRDGGRQRGLPDGAPFSSVPPSLLLKLPPLPEQVRYRFVGRTLILRDTEANVILDFIPDVVPDPSIPR